MAQRGRQGGQFAPGSLFEKLKMHSKFYLTILKMMAVIYLGPYTDSC